MSEFEEYQQTSNIFKETRKSFNTETGKSLTTDVALVLILSFLTAVVTVITITTIYWNRPKLENHENCGVTTGGQVRKYCQAQHQLMNILITRFV